MHIFGCRCNERLKAKTEGSTRLADRKGEKGTRDCLQDISAPAGVSHETVFKTIVEILKRPATVVMVSHASQLLV